MCGPISFCIAISTPAICFPGMSCSGVFFGLGIASELIILYPFTIWFVLCGMCVSCIIAMCILCLISCCVMSCCAVLAISGSGLRLVIEIVFIPFVLFITVCLICPSWGSLCLRLLHYSPRCVFRVFVAFRFFALVFIFRGLPCLVLFPPSLSILW